VLYKFFMAGALAAGIFASMAEQALGDETEVCEGLSASAFGLCRSAIATGCNVLPTSRPEACEKLEAKFKAASGGMVPPWLVVPDPDSTAQLTPVNLMVPFNPQPVRGTDSKYHLVYELQIQNFGSFGAVPAPPPPAALLVEEVAVFDTADPGAEPIFVLEGEALVERMQLVHLSARFPGTPPPIELQPAQSAIVFFDLVFDERDAVPASLTHLVRVSAVPGTGPEPVVNQVAKEIEVNQAPVIVIGPSQRGGDWANFNGCCDFPFPHRRVVRSVDGAEFLPERYAADTLGTLKIDGVWELFDGTGDYVDEWFGTGTEVLAVGDGVVTRVVTGVANNPIGESPFPPVLPTGGGNEVLVHMGDGIFAMYGHLLPGTVSLEVGDRVTRGEVVGLLGNTGVSTAPHLHFQVMDANTIAETDGLPFVYDEFELIGTFEDINPVTGALEGVVELPVPELRQNEMPLQNTIIRFVE